MSELNEEVSFSLSIADTTDNPNLSVLAAEVRRLIAENAQLESDIAEARRIGSSEAIVSIIREHLTRAEAAERKLALATSIATNLLRNIKNLCRDMRIAEIQESDRPDISVIKEAEDILTKLSSTGTR